MFDDACDDRVLYRSVDFSVALVIDPRDLLISRRHDAQLSRRAPGGIRNDACRVDTQRLQLSEQSRCFRICPGDADRLRTPAERHDIARDIRGAAEAVLLAVELHDRHGSFRRNPGDTAVDEVVEHQVADDEDGPAGNPAEQRVESGHRQAACDGWWSAGAVAGARSAA